MLATILGGMSRARFQRGLGGGSAWHSAGASAGYFAASTYTGEWRWLARWLEAHLERAIRKVQDHGVSAAELARAQHDLQNGSLPGLDSNLGLADRITDEVTLTGGLAYLEESHRRIAAVTAAQVQAVARRYLRPERECVVELRRRRGAQGTKAPRPAEPAPPLAAPVPEGTRRSAAFTRVLREIAAVPPLRPAGPALGKDVDRVVLPSGITLFMQEDHSRPLVTLHFAWRGGVNTAPLHDLDAYELADGLLSASGTARLSAAQLAERKRELGMSFHVALGETLSQASLSAPSQYFRPSYALAMDILMHPRIGEARTWTSKIQFAHAMRTRAEGLSSGASSVMDQVLTGAHPRLGYVPGKWRLMLTTWPYQVRRLWRRYLGRDNLAITAVGDFDKRELPGLIEGTLGRWRRAQDARRQWITRAPVVRPGAYLVRRPLPGAAVVLAQELAVDRSAPEADHAALEVLEALLGQGGFRSRLMNRLRVEEGLTYHVAAAIAHEGRPGVPGVLRVAYQTRTGQVYRSIVSALEEIERLRQEAVPQALLDEQLAVWRSRLAFFYGDPVANVNRLMMYELDDRPFDYDQRSIAARERVTPADVLRVARRYLRPQDLTIALYGSLSAAEEAQIKARFGLTVLTEKQVFRGGYE